MTHQDIYEDEDWEEQENEEGLAEPVVLLDMVVSNGQEPERIDKFLQGKIERSTRSKIQLGIEKGLVYVNEQNTIKANYKIKSGDHIVVFDHRVPEMTDIVPEPMDLDIVYEDDQLMVINKPAGMVVHPGCGNYSGTLLNGLAYYLKIQPEDLPRIGLVHRIDKDTTGLLLIAKTQEAMQFLGAQFKAHTVHRRYIALVWGNMETDEGTITGHIGRHQRFRKLFTVYPDGDHGKHAVTHYKVLERFYYTTLVELRLETGRTHQIRVHMKYIGHTLFGDETYGGDTILKGTVHHKYKQFVDNNLAILPRQALHAAELGFIHPTTKAEMRFKSDLPSDMQQVINRWKDYINTNIIKS